MANVGKSRPSSFLELPPDFFDGAHVVTCEDDEGCLPSLGDRSHVSELSSRQLDIVPPSSLNRWACNTCSNLEFSSLDEQRFHFKSDFHRFNVKRKLIGKVPISEEGFEVLAQGQHQKDDDVSSISGSEEDDIDSSDEGEANHHKSFSTSKLQNYVSVMLPSSDEIATFWKCVVSRDNERLSKHEDKIGLGGRDLVSEEALLQRLKKFIPREGPEESSLWAILLLRGGHFAGCVFECKKGSILAHKTYHRYVVRAKAGGKQSTKDGTGRAPKSAGASLRRHNEASLNREIRELLASWKCHLEAASCIFFHAPSRNSHVLFGGEDAPLNRNDKRVRNVPFTTRRPTFKEAKWVFSELITITYQKKEAFDATSSASSSKSNSKKLQEGIAVDVGIENLISKGVKDVAEPTFSSAEKQREGSDTQSENASVGVKIEISTTPLHNASQLGQVDLVLELLEKGANPCSKDHRGRTPYSLATDKETRNAFRRFMAANIDMWDWHAASVPSALTDEMEAAQAAKQAEKDAKRKAKAKEQKKARKERLKTREAAAASSEKMVSESTLNLTQNSSSIVAQDLLGYFL
ncbi:hypothetical protein GOP47_0022761 [Adiantum capillus-veneris]|uniref:VLRF1 domain-containing protein n=1 Tax=Adiantum capillus-veneris TaxID=13818 RepID=A0A9D4U6F4_ADICA|nr:hypothetical protein GOP47_0022761 [Adiantum capillus-veneris]